MDLTPVITTAATIIASIGGAWATARKVAGGRALSKALAYALREEREVGFPVVLVTQNGFLDRAAELRTMLVKRGFRAVRCQAAESYEPGPDIFVYVAAGDHAGDLLAAICRAGQSSGLIYTPPGFPAPAGDWTFANSPVTLYARLRELIAFRRAAG